MKKFQSDLRSNWWKWEVSGFEPRKLSSTSAAAAAAAATATASFSPASQLPLASKVQRLADDVQLARQDYLELRQEAIELQEYSNTKLNRVTQSRATSAFSPTRSRN